ncbi:hypothetical protein FQZ97_1278220 [compost metagenome]
MRFVLHEVFQAPSLWARLPALADTVDADAILEEAAKVTGGLIAPLRAFSFPQRFARNPCE